ncbi:MAG: hypothetical protein J7K88_11065 [Candidatus Fermentibacteraceae bacterium]|nr:hypothetical protein [Candidatus Fermentibacteraceae bacterium]
MSDKNFDLAEQEVKQSSERKIQQKKSISSKKGKLIAIGILFVAFVAIGVNSFLEIKKLNAPPEQTKEEIIQDMSSYLFMVIAQLDAFTNETGSLPSSEEDFLGEDDPYIEYSVVGDGYQLQLSYADTTIFFSSDEDPSQLLTEEALIQMGIPVD